MANEISLVICAYTEKRWNELIAAVKSVQCQTLPAKEIIVVVDRNPGLQMRVKEALPDIIVIENCQAKGASGARNSGAARAQGNILVFLDDDAVASPDWLEKLVTCYADPDVAGVGGRILPSWGGRRPSWFPEEFYWVIGCSYQGQPAENTSVRNLIGANMSVRKDIMVLVGGFRESFGNNKDTDATKTRSKWFHHHAGDEETEFCIRVSKQLPGSIWLYTASAVVQHYVPLQRTRWTFFLWRCYDEGLGKASLVKLHSVQTGLSAERTYTFKTLPAGIARGLADVFLRHDIAGLLRAGTIMIGLTVTVAGYLVGRASLFVEHSSSSDSTVERQHLTTETHSPVEV